MLDLSSCTLRCVHPQTGQPGLFSQGKPPPGWAVGRAGLASGAPCAPLRSGSPALPLLLLGSAPAGHWGTAFISTSMEPVHQTRCGMWWQNHVKSLWVQAKVARQADGGQVQRAFSRPHLGPADSSCGHRAGRNLGWRVL